MKSYVIIALVLLIAGSAFIVVRSLAPDSPQGPAEGAHDPDYVCYKCGEMFSLTREALGAQEIDPAIARKDPTAARRPHCPLCHAKHSGFMTVSCLSCGRSYLPPTTLPRGSAVTAEAEDVCPHCGADRSEDYRNRRAGGTP